MTKAKSKTRPPKKNAKTTKGKPDVKKGKPWPRSQALPGMESKIPVRLRNYCEAIGEIREKKNQLNQDEKVEIAGAMKAMREEKREVVKWAGVELVFVKGDDKLRVRLVSDGGDGDSDEDAGDPAPVESTQADGPGEPFNPPDRAADAADDPDSNTADL